ncbi:MAG: HAD-IIB family hydrolase [Parcubacteria group bacterium]|nr:HAD-IIB family hydrolase [Parcubacteria group bacterium]
MKYKKIIFDMDGTLTVSRGEMGHAFVEIFEKLCAAFTVAVISGADVGQMHAQIPFKKIWKRTERDLYLMALNGNVCVWNGEEKWRTALFWRDRMEILKHISALRDEFPCEITDESDLVEDRAAQVSFSFIGHHAPREKKAEFDKKGILRSTALAKVPFASENIVVKVGGTTCLDYMPKNGTKAHNTARLFGEEGLKDALFVGDNLTPGGNDAVMIGVTDCIMVESPVETFYLVERLLRGDALPEVIPAA